MERDPHHPEGGDQRNDHAHSNKHDHDSDTGHGTGHETGYDREPIYDQLRDEQRIQRGIADALTEERSIDDATARRIAAQLHGGQASALYALASSGALPEALERELGAMVQELPPERDSWVDALLDYADARDEDRGPREGWTELTADEPQRAIEAARAEASRVRRADREKLARYVEAGLDPDEAEALIEYERLSPEQRAAWAGIASEQAEAGEQPDHDPTQASPSPQEQRGDTAAGQDARDSDRFDWFSDAGTPSGEAGPVPSGESPATADENELLPEHEPTPRPSPRIYVADLAAYTAGRLHGVWLDVTRDVDDLWRAVQAMLARSPVADAEEIAIHDHEDFAGYPLGEHESLDFVVQLARGIAEHGQAFAAYADWNRAGDPELARFAEAHEGTYPTRAAWAQEVADEVFEWPRYLEQIPEPLRSSVRFDYADFALTLEQDRHVVEGDEGVYVFNPHV